MRATPVWRGANSIETAGADTATSSSIITTGGAANAKGVYQTIIAATARPASGLLLNVRPITTRHALDIAIGAAASEQIIIPDLLFADAAENITPIFLPISIPSGVRLAARSSSSTASGTCRVQALLMHGEAGRYGRGTTYGFDLANTRGTVVTAGAVNVKGAYAVLSASTANPIRALYVMFSGGTLAAAHSGLADIAIGGAGVEFVVVANIMWRHASVTSVKPSVIGPFFVDIPAATRLTAKVQTSTASQDVSIAILGLD